MESLAKGVCLSPVYLWVLLLVMQAADLPLLGQFGSPVQYFAQVALNQGSTTSFTINNPSTTETIIVDAQLYFPDGTPLADGQVELGPGATQTLSFGDAEANLTPGWAELKSEEEFISMEFFQLSIAGQLKPVGVLPSVESDEIRFLGFVNPQFKSGLAVSNPSSTEATEITVRVKDRAGQEPVGEKTLTLAPLECITGFLNEVLFFGAAVTNYEGVVEISANSPGVAALSLIQEVATGDVATVSVLTQDHIITDTDNTALGVGALFSNTIGNKNTANGVGALFSNTAGSRNTGLGENTLRNNTSGHLNTAVGSSSLFTNITGSRNTAVGVSSLQSNTIGERNTAVGDSALGKNTTGSRNTATGTSALLNNTTGDSNTARGVGALARNTTGSDNTANGVSALLFNSTGAGNTATGRSALFNNITGSSNTAVGDSALFRSLGSDNIGIGFEAGGTLETGDNNIYIGHDGQTTESNTIRIGDGSHTDAVIAGVSIVAPSSKRFKEDIHDMGEASSNLMGLRPVTFHYKKEYDAGDPRLQYGLIAEEVADVYPELVLNDETGKARTVLYQKLNVMLLNELQKQHQQIQELTERLTRLERSLRAKQALFAGQLLNE